MNIIETTIAGLYIIENIIHNDLRGRFVKTFDASVFNKNHLDTQFVESYYSMSHKNVIRGMHFQIPPHDHTKLVYVTAGSICDVVVDLRKDSSTYGAYVEEELSDTNGKSFYIPKGCAHGFKTMSDSATVTYLTTTVYSPDHDKGILWNSFGFDWNITNPIISERDTLLPSLQIFESPF